MGTVRSSEVLLTNSHSDAWTQIDVPVLSAPAPQSLEFVLQSLGGALERVAKVARPSTVEKKVRRKADVMQQREQFTPEERRRIELVRFVTARCTGCDADEWIIATCGNPADAILTATASRSLKPRASLRAVLSCDRSCSGRSS